MINSLNSTVNFQGQIKKGNRIKKTPDNIDRSNFEKLFITLGAVASFPHQTIINIKDFSYSKTDDAREYTFTIDPPNSLIGKKDKSFRITVKENLWSGNMDILMQNAKTTPSDSTDGYSFNTAASKLKQEFVFNFSDCLNLLKHSPLLLNHNKEQ